ncbi:hypothetical protein AB6F20_15515 [Providencia hangzhouensis]|uniref:hypothetical protein n=1 Tax=Providencia hangzhouensis TaxID=3031799 RepID=UPI0034DDADA5
MIASGRQRACYQHPEYNHLCVKVHASGRDDKETLERFAIINACIKKESYRKNDFSLLWRNRAVIGARICIPINQR